MPINTLAGFFTELKRRKVIRVAIAYVIVSWIIVEVASVMFPGMLLPDWSVRLVIGLAILGFPFAMVLAWAIDVTPDGLKLDKAPVAEEPPPSIEIPKEDDGNRQLNSVAVLPFLNLSNDPDNEYFSDGMSEELLNLLCKLPQLTVASRTSSFSFKGKDVDMATVARQLDVDVILEGSVRRVGDRVRITAQLIDARRDRHLWSENYDRELKDVFAVQDEIAQKIVQALELSLTPEQQKSISKKASTESIEAYDFYLRGRYFFERNEIDHAQTMFERSTENDPEFAPAWGGIAECYAWRIHWVDNTPENRRAADEYSQRALELAPESAEAHAARCSALAMMGRHEEADREAARAIAIDPQLYEAHIYRGRNAFSRGEHRQAFSAFAKAAEIRPDDHAAAVLKSTAIKAFGTPEEYRKVAEQGLKCIEKHLALNPDDALAMSRAAGEMVFLGRLDEGKAMALRAYELNPSICGYNVGCVLVLAGEIDKALDILEEHAASRGLHTAWIEHDSDWDSVRDHPRFQAVLRGLKAESESR